MNQPASQPITTENEEWLKVLGKGMVTLPKAWRDELGIVPGKLIRAKKVENTVILEPSQQEAPYRVYSNEEINSFLKDDRLPLAFKEKIDKRIKELKK